MKNFWNIIFVVLSSFVFLSSANGQPLANGGGQSSGRVRVERIRKSSFIVEKYVDLNQVSANQSSVYELRCRGGGNLEFQIVGSRIHSSGAVMTTLELSFSPSLQAAGANSGGLQPGECALVDRPFYLDEVGQIREPLKIRFETPSYAQLKQTQGGSEVDRSAMRAESYPDENSIKEYLKSPNRYWSFFVQNTGQRYFEAKSHRHWKKRMEDKIYPKGGVLIKPF